LLVKVLLGEIAIEPPLEVALQFLKVLPMLGVELIMYGAFRYEVFG
jgi:hypothetical protein